MAESIAAPTVTIGGSGTLTLADARDEFVMSKKLAAKYPNGPRNDDGKRIAIVRKWATLQTDEKEAEVGTDDAGLPIVDMLERNHWAAKVPAPQVKGKSAPLPTACTVTAWGEKHSVALAAFDNGERADGTRKVYVYGAITIERGAATYAYHVRVAPMADGVTWKVAALLAQ